MEKKLTKKFLASWLMKSRESYLAIHQRREGEKIVKKFKKFNVGICFTLFFI